MAPRTPKTKTTDSGAGDDAVVFTITFTKGLADRNRLPIDQVVKTLNEFQDLVRELGRRVQRADGQDDPDGDFGLEILAGPEGNALRKGSVIARAEATRDVSNARKVFELIASQSRDYSKRVTTDLTVESSIVARRMFNIAKLQVGAKSLVAFQMRGIAGRSTKVSVDESAYLHLLKARERLMRVDGLHLYGKLRQLKDRSKTDNSDGHFWGELVTEQQDIWRLRFDAKELKTVLPLFMHQVGVTGDATYFGPAKSPRLRVTHVEADPERNYLKAFDAIRASGNTFFGKATTEDLLMELYG